MSRGRRTLRNAIPILRNSPPNPLPVSRKIPTRVAGRRRKTDKSQPAEPTTTSNAGLTAWLGNGPPIPIIRPAETSWTVKSICLRLRLNLRWQRPSFLQMLPQFRRLRNMTKQKSESEGHRRGRRPSNLIRRGKFLSSPASSPPRETKKRATGKRGRPPKDRPKLVIIKYRVDREGKTGEVIDSILSGTLVHRPPVPLPNLLCRHASQQR